MSLKDRKKVFKNTELANSMKHQYKKCALDLVVLEGSSLFFQIIAIYLPSPSNGRLYVFIE